MNQTLISFLLEAKKATYAASMSPSPEPSRPSSKDLLYKSGDWKYIDTYLGDINFIGEEAVWHQNKPVWGMNYYGWMETDVFPSGFSECLKTALSLAPEETPFRGPASFKYQELTYQCSWTGSMQCFSGEESISHCGKIMAIGLIKCAAKMPSIISKPRAGGKSVGRSDMVCPLEFNRTV